MHNGGIAEFPMVKRRLQQDLPDAIFDVVQGNTGMHSAPIRRSIRYLHPSLQCADCRLTARLGVGVCVILVQGACLSRRLTRYVLTGPFPAPRLQRSVVYIRNATESDGGNGRSAEWICRGIQDHRGTASPCRGKCSY